MARRWQRKTATDVHVSEITEQDVELPSSSPEHIAACVKKLTSRTFEKDRGIPSNVKIQVLPPSSTGFPTYYRRGRELGFAEWVVPDGASNQSPRILYFHGGGYEYMNPKQFRATTGRLAAGTGMPVLVIDYRKIPEHPHPAQLDDAVQAFEWILEHGPHGKSPASAILGSGSSAGGGLALALAVKLRDEPGHGGQLVGVTVSSPQTDMTCSGESYTTRKWCDGGGDACDPIFRGADPSADSMPQIYKLLGKPGRRGSYPLHEPSISPLHAELHKLPPTLIHVGDAEVMLSDSVDFGLKAKAAGSPVQVTVWPRMWHCFERFSEGCGTGTPIKEGQEALRRQVAFLHQCASAVLPKDFKIEALPMSEVEMLCRASAPENGDTSKMKGKGKGKGKSKMKGKGKGVESQVAVHSKHLHQQMVDSIMGA